MQVFGYWKVAIKRLYFWFLENLTSIGALEGVARKEWVTVVKMWVLPLTKLSWKVITWAERSVCALCAPLITAARRGQQSSGLRSICFLKCGSSAEIFSFLREMLASSSVASSYLWDAFFSEINVTIPAITASRKFSLPLFSSEIFNTKKSSLELSTTSRKLWTSRIFDIRKLNLFWTHGLLKIVYEFKVPPNNTGAAYTVIHFLGFPFPFSNNFSGTFWIYFSDVLSKPVVKFRTKIFWVCSLIDSLGQSKLRGVWPLFRGVWPSFRPYRQPLVKCN